MSARHRFLAILVVILLAAISCRRTEAAADAPPAGEIWLTAEQIRGARLVIAPVGQRALAIHLVTPGRVAFDEGRVAHVFSPVSGRVTQVLAPFGGRVRQGDPLAVLESPDLGSAWADLLKARADDDAAEHELARQKDLLAHRASAERDLEAAQDNAAKTAAELERARFRLRTLHAPEDGVATQEFVLRAPIAGEVVNRTATPGLEIQGMLSSANVVQELFTVGEFDPIWVWGDIYERDLGRVRRGQAVAIATDSDPEHPLASTVDYVSQALDPQTHTGRVRCVLPNADRRLKPEMFVTLSIEVDRRESAALPREAVIKAGDRQTVFVEHGKTSDGRTRFLQQAIVLGDADDGWVAVASGLAPGDRVVTAGSILLSGGSD